MGTRSSTVVVDAGRPLINMYRQFDGYPSAQGQDLADFLDGMVILNGIPRNTPKKFANGAACLAAQMLAHFKTDPGGIYVHPLDRTDEEFNYEVHVSTMEPEQGVRVVCRSRDEVLFDGGVDYFKAFCAADAA